MTMLLRPIIDALMEIMVEIGLSGFRVGEEACRRSAIRYRSIIQVVPSETAG